MPEQLLNRRSEAPRVTLKVKRLSQEPAPSPWPKRLALLLAVAVGGALLGQLGSAVVSRMLGGGNSGGPVFDMQGNVIAIHFAGDGRQSGYAVPIRYGMQLFPNGGTLNVLELQRFWSVVFLDFGNTWEQARDMMVREVAMAVGFGLRYETFVGPFRFDIAWRLYDPKKPMGEQWLSEQQFFHNSFSIVHFGIGHAF